MSENIHHLSGNLLVGSSHFFVDTTNNRVGITTVDPDAGLHVNSNAYVHTDFRVGSGIAMNVTGGRITAGSFEGDGSLLENVPGDSGSWVNGTNSNVHLATSTDKVGIGTTSPQAPLHLFKSGAGANQEGGGIILQRYNNYQGSIWNEYNGTFNKESIYFRVRGNEPASTTYGGSPQMSLDHDGKLRMKYLNSSGTDSLGDLGGYLQTYSASGADGGMKLGATSWNSIDVDGMYFRYNGNIGINTSLPQTALHIQNLSQNSGTGDAYISGRTYKPTECLRLTGQWRGTGSGALLRFTNTHGGGTNPNTGEYNTAGIAGFDNANAWGGGLALYTSPNTSGGGDLTPRMIIDSFGNIGLGTSTFVDSRALLHIKNHVGGIAFQGSTNSNSRNWRIRNDDMADHGSFQIAVSANNSSHPSSGSHAVMTMLRSRYVGIGTVNPNCPLHVSGQNTIAIGDTFRTYSSSGESDAVSGSATRDISIRASNRIHSHGGFVASSDERIKKDIQDVEDDECLVKLRQLEPKTYKYRDVVERGDKRVYGYIAQQVETVVPEAVSTTRNLIDNILELCEAESNVITFTSFNTSNLVSNASTLEVIGIDGGSHEVNIVDVIDAKTIQVDTDLSKWLGSVDENGNVITETTITTLTEEEYEELEDKNGYIEEEGSWTKTTTTNVGKNIVVKGQVVDDFKILNKDYLWTIATSALQEVDRQLQTTKINLQTTKTQLEADLQTTKTQLEADLQTTLEGNLSETKSELKANLQTTQTELNTHTHPLEEHTHPLEEHTHPLEPHTHPLEEHTHPDLVDQLTIEKAKTRELQQRLTLIEHSHAALVARLETLEEKV